MKKLLCTLWVCMMVCMGLHANITITFTPDHPRQSFVLNKDCSQCTVSLKSQKDKTCAFTIYDHAGQEVSAKDGKKIHFISSGTKVFYTLQAGEHYTVDSHLDPGDQGFTIVISDSEGTAATLDQMRAGAVELPASAQGRYLVDAPITSGSGTELTDHAWYRISYSDVRPAMIYAEGVARLSMRLVAYNASTGELTEVGTRTTYNLDNLYTYAFDQSGAEYYLLLRSRDQIGWVDYPLVCKPQEELRPYWEACANEAPTVSESRGYLSFHTEPSDQIGLMGYRWYKFVPQYTGKYSISTVNTSGDLINGVNKPCALLLSADLDILGNAYQNDPTNLTEFLLQYDMEAGTTYYLLVKDYDNIAGSTRINITCQKWVDEQPKDTEDGLVSITFTPANPVQSFVLNHNYRLCSISVLTQKDDICSITVRDRQGNEIAASDGQTKHFISKTTPVHYVFHPGELYIIDSHLGADDRGFTIEMIGRDGTPATIEEMSARAAGNGVIKQEGTKQSLRCVPIVEGDGSKLTDYVWYKVDPEDKLSMTYASGAGKYGMKVVVYGLVKHEPSNPVLLPTYSMDYIEQGTTKYYNLDPIISYDFNYQSDFNGDMPEQSEPQYYLLLRAEDKIGKVDFSISREMDEGYLHDNGGLWPSTIMASPHVSEGTHDVSFQYQGTIGQKYYIGYTSYRFRPECTEHYIIKTINTSPDPVNGRNEPAMLLLDYHGNILAQAHRNDPDSPTECRLEYDMKSNITYYILVKDYANIAEPTCLRISCPTWELLEQKAKGATPMSMGENLITLTDVDPDASHHLLRYDWFKLVAPYTDNYKHYHPNDVGYVWLDEDLKRMSDMNFTEGKTYYLLMHKEDNSEYAKYHYLDCPKQLEYDKANVYPEQFAKAETLSLGANMLSIPAIKDTYGYRDDFNYHVAQIVPTAITDYYFFTDGPVKYKLYDQNLNLVTRYRLSRKPYYVLYRRTDLSATPEGEQDMLYINSIGQHASSTVSFALGENTFTTQAVLPSLKDEIFGYNVVKYTPKQTGDYFFYPSEGLEYQLFDSSLKPITYRNLTANSAVYIGYRRKDFSATPEGKQDTLYICCRESLVADCKSFTEGENVFTTSAITPMLTDMFGGYNVRKFVPKYTSDYFLYTSDGLEYKVLDSSLNTVEGSQLTKDATYYIAYRRKDLKDTPEGIQDKLYISCRENFIAGCESFSEGENVFTTFAINPLQKDEIYGYNVRRFVPEYTGDYYFNASESIEFKIVTPYLSEKEGSHPHLTRGDTYYILYRHKDLSATPEGKQDFLFIECNGFWLDTSHIEGALYEGENEVSLLPPLQEEHQQLFRGYHRSIFVPSESGIYYFEGSDPSLDVRVFDGSQAIVFAGTSLFENRKYTILYRYEGDALSDDNALGIINIVKEADIIDRMKQLATDLSVGANTLELQPVDNPRPYESIFNYHIGKFRTQLTCEYAFECDDNIDYFVTDEELYPIDMTHGCTLMGYENYYIFYKVKDGADASATSSLAYIVSEKAMLALGLNSIYSYGDEGRYPSVDLELSYCPMDVRLEFAEDVDYKFIYSIDDEVVESATWEECMAGYDPVIRVRRTDGQSGLMDIRVIPEIDIDGELHVGDNHVVADPISPKGNGYMSHWFSFTPERTDKYVFISDETEVSTFIIDAEELTEVKYAYDPDVWYFGRVIFEIELQAGHEYYIGMTAYDSKNGHANIIVAYEDNETVLQSYALSPAQPLDETELLTLPQLPANVRTAVETYKEYDMPYEAYLISTPEELAWLGDLLSSDPDKNVVAVLANDIVMNDVMTMPMSRFATVKQATPYLWNPISRNGEGDTHIIGQGHTIRGLYYDSWHNSLDKHVRYAGLFGDVTYMHLYDVGLEQFSITHGSELGAFAGKASFSTFDGCWVKSARCFIQYLSSNYSNLRNAVGGFVGIADAVDFTNCYSEINCYLKESINTWNNGGAFAGTLTGRTFRHSQVANNYACGTTFTDVFVSDVQQYIDCENNYYAASNYTAFSNNLNATKAEHPETGEYAYRLQGSQERHYWGQYIGRDPHPVLHSSLRVAYDAEEDRYYNPVVGDYNGDGTVDMADVTTLRDIVIEKQGDKHHVGSLTNTKQYEKPHIADIPLLIDLLKK